MKLVRQNLIIPDCGRHVVKAVVISCFSSLLSSEASKEEESERFLRLLMELSRAMRQPAPPTSVSVYTAILLRVRPGPVVADGIAGVFYYCR